MNQQKTKCERHLGLRITAEDEILLMRLSSKAGLSKSLYCKRLLRAAMNKEAKKEQKL